MAEFEGGDVGSIFRPTEEEDCCPFTIYLQTVSCGGDDSSDLVNNNPAALLSGERKTVREIAEAVSFELDCSRETLISSNELVREHCLVGEARPSLIHEVADGISDRIHSVGISVQHVLSHECSSLPIFTGVGIESTLEQKGSHDEIVLNGLCSGKVSEVFGEQGFGVIKDLVSNDPVVTQAAARVREHIASMMKTVSMVQQINEQDRIKYCEVMQRDVGRFDIALDDAPGLREFVSYASFGLAEINDLEVAHDHWDAERAPWLEVIDACLGADNYEYCRTGVVVSTGGCRATSRQYWHADGQEELAPRQAVCLFIPLCDLTNTSGFTSFWPGSQLYKQSSLLEHGLPDKMPEGAIIQGKVNYGDCIVYDYKLIHRGEANHMQEGEMRPIVYVIYTVHGYSEPNFNVSSIYDVLSRPSRTEDPATAAAVDSSLS